MSVATTLASLTRGAILQVDPKRIALHRRQLGAIDQISGSEEARHDVVREHVPQQHLVVGGHQGIDVDRPEGVIGGRENREGARTRQNVDEARSRDRRHEGGDVRGERSTLHRVEGFEKDAVDQVQHAVVDDDIGGENVGAVDPGAPLQVHTDPAPLESAQDLPIPQIGRTNVTANDMVVEHIGQKCAVRQEG